VGRRSITTPCCPASIRFSGGRSNCRQTPLSDFRSANGEFLDERLTDNLAGLMAAGVVKLEAAAQDGMRVRASAGAGSFRREDKLKGYLETARQRVAVLKVLAPAED
jgi:hypothetical protein